MTHSDPSSHLDRHLALFRCPHCQAALAREGPALTCGGCGRTYPASGVVRFTEDAGYADSFGLQWKVFSRVQLDTPALRDSERRLRQETGLLSQDLREKVVLEAGCGMGRFLDVVSRDEAALAVGVDLSGAVDAAADNLKDRNNCLIVQGDLFRLPFAPGSFDVIYSIGVLHHTPSARDAFLALVPFLKPGGTIAISVYEHSAGRGALWEINMLRRRLFRVVTRRLPRGLLLGWSRYAIPAFWVIDKIPVVRYVRYAFPTLVYKNYPLAWSQLDTFDSYATQLESRHSAKEVYGWFRDAKLEALDLLPSDNGWVSVRGRRPADATS